MRERVTLPRAGGHRQTKINSEFSIQVFIQYETCMIYVEAFTNYFNKYQLHSVARSILQKNKNHRM